MKESFQRIIAWAKAHPLLAVLIVGGVVLLAYLVYKRSGGMAPTSGPGAESGIPAGYGAGGAVGGGGSTGTISGMATEGGAAIPSISTLTGALAPQTANVAHAIPGAQTKPELPAGLFPGVGGSNLGWLTGLGALSGATPGTGGSGGNIAARNAGFGGSAKPPINPTEFHTGVTSQPVPAIPGPSPITNALGRGAGVTGSPAAGGGGSTAQYRGRGGSAPETPAMAVGKGRLFSGTYQGITYASGYPVGSVTATQVTGLTGNRPAVIPTQGQTIRY